MTDEAAAANTAYLASHHHDFTAAIAAQLHSPVGVGSEFRRLEVLAPLLHRHPLWKHLEAILTTGAELPL
jgi:hypothetical protein